MSITQRFHDDGFVMVPAVLPAHALASLTPVVLEAGAVGGSRCLLDRPEISELAVTLREHAVIGALIPADHIAVQCTYFEKSVDRNWLVAVHQDLSIPVAEHVESSELKGWSQKEGALFVQPGREVLEQLIAVRLHLDPCTLSDGPLRVVPGSHQLGVLSAEQAINVRNERGEIPCDAQAGDALLLRPLTLHASSRSTGSGRRRVLHILFGAKPLPHGLKWAERPRPTLPSQT